MSEQKESSVLFNLKELMNLEEDRIQSEEEAQQQAQEEARARAEAEERRKRAEEEARIQAEADARAAEERAVREEAERKQRANEEAALRVRLEAEAKARAEEHQRLLEHEQQLAKHKASAKKGVHPGIILGLVGVLLVGALGSYFGVVKPGMERRAAEAQAARQLAEQYRASDRFASKGLAHVSSEQVLRIASSSRTGVRARRRNDCPGGLCA